MFAYSEHQMQHRKVIYHQELQLQKLFENVTVVSVCQVVSVLEEN